MLNGEKNRLPSLLLNSRYRSRAKVYCFLGPSAFRSRPRKPGVSRFVLCPNELPCVWSLPGGSGPARMPETALGSFPWQVWGVWQPARLLEWASGSPGRVRRPGCSRATWRSPPAGARRRPRAKSLAVFWTRLLRQTFAPCFPYRACRCLTSARLDGGLRLWVFTPSGGREKMLHGTSTGSIVPELVGGFFPAGRRQGPWVRLFTAAATPGSEGTVRPVASLLPQPQPSASPCHRCPSASCTVQVNHDASAPVPCSRMFQPGRASLSR